MIQLQALNSILSNNNLDEYIRSGINSDYFGEYISEYNYIVNHYHKYNKVPDMATFLTQFPQFDVIEVMEPFPFIIEALKEEYVYEQGVELFQQSAQLLQKNSFDGLQNIINKAETLLHSNIITKGTDINQLVEERINDIRSKQGKDGLLGISSGMPELDDILGGWLPGEELVTVVGRVNQGKSWLLQKFLTEAHKQNKRILHYSGEMGVLQVAYRHDTLGNHFSNRQLMRATISETDLNQYEQTLKQNSTTLLPYMLVTPKDLGGKMLTISMLRALIKEHKPDVVGIDQISLMVDERGKGESRRIQYTHIAEDLFNLSIEFGIPIIADAQANRNKTDMENPENPDLEDIGESDGVGQNSSRVISLVQTKMGLSLYIAKNRFGENKKKLIYSWDIDIGTFRYVEQEGGVTPPTGEPQLTPRNRTKPPATTDVF